MIHLDCPAKFNLFLAITGKDDTGYHTIETVFVRLPQLMDHLHLEPAPKTSLSCTHDAVPEDASNTVLKALGVLEQHCQRPLPHKIHIEKHIPPGSGLGGAASNAASLMLHLNKSLEIPQEKLLQLGARVGMDVPFFLSQYTLAHGTHFGEKITPLPSLAPEITFQIHFAERAQSTQEAFAAWDTAQLHSTADIQSILTAIHSRKTADILKHMHNDFELIYSPAAVASEQILAGSGAAVISVHLGSI